MDVLGAPTGFVAVVRRSRHDLFRRSLAVATYLAQGALQNVGSAIMEQQLSNLGLKRKLKDEIADLIRDAVREIAAIIHEEIEAARLRDVLLDMKGAVNELDNYRVAPRTSRDRLVNATTKIETVAAHLSGDFGLKAHPSYLAAIGVQLAIQEERIRRFGQDEKKVTVRIVNELALPRVEQYHAEWLDWSRRRFGRASCAPVTGAAVPLADYVAWCRYTFETKVIRMCFRRSAAATAFPNPNMSARQFPWDVEVRCQTLDPVPPGRRYLDAGNEQAEAQRRAHMAQLDADVTARYITPSRFVVDQWKKLADGYESGR
jgi:hypothetical protein